MCGFAGKISFNPGRLVSEATVESMAELLNHRGPDQEGFHHDPQITLGHKRLSIIGCKNGAQPIYNEDQSVVLVANGEIYNHIELKQELIAKGHRFRTDSDNEVIIHLYEEFGPQSVNRLEGMFAYVLWDDHKQLFVMARDRMGQKPVYYYSTEQGISFASELNSLMQDPEIPKDVNQEAMVDYLRLMYTPLNKTFWKDVYRLSPARLLTADKDGLKVRRYWQPDYRTKKDISYEDACDELNRLFKSSTKKRLMSEVPLGAFLSGGLDSSAVVAAMIELGVDVNTYSITFQQKQFDESQYANFVSKHLGTKHNVYEVDSDSFESVESVLEAFGEPFADSSAIAAWQLAKFTSQDLKVVLSGDGGDEIFTGYERYANRILLEKYIHLPRAVQNIFLQSSKIISSLGGPVGNWFCNLENFLSQSDQDEISRLINKPALFHNAALDQLLSAEFKSLLGDYSSREVIEEVLSDVPTKSGVGAHIASDIATFLPGDILTKVDITSMQHSLEVRSPFMDHELVEFALRLPLEYRISKGRTKRILKDVMKPKLTGKITERAKKGFRVPVGEWFRGPLQHKLKAVLLDHTSLKGVVNQDVVAEMIHDHISGKVDHEMRLWSLYVLELWRRKWKIF